MSHNIDAIMLDTGNTMRTVIEDPPLQFAARQELAKLLGSKDSPDVFCNKLEEHYKAYKKWTKENLVAIPEKEVWTRWMLPDHPEEEITPLVEKLCDLWNAQGGHRVIRPDVKTTVIELNKRGYILGIIANSTFEREIPDWLEENGIRDCFKALALSAKLGIRKPNPEIFLEAARMAEVEPARCAYVGDNPVRDIQGAKSAGYKLVVIMLEPATLKKERPQIKSLPDFLIYKFSDLLGIFRYR
jgi:putative hydrolase of the HAD superfamily